MNKELEEKIKLLREKEKTEKELEKLKVKNDDGGAAKDIIVGTIVFLIPFAGIFTAESFAGKMTCLVISLLILLIGFNWYNQKNKKKKRLEIINKKLKELDKKTKNQS